jgi:hypothetical protein
VRILIGKFNCIPPEEMKKKKKTTGVIQAPDPTQENKRTEDSIADIEEKTSLLKS